MIQARDLSKTFGRVAAVRGVGFDVPRGQVVGLLGTNGAGKTTTLRMVTGFMPPDRGRVSIDGHDTLDHSLAARRRIGYLPEAAPAYGEMAVRDYLDFRGRLYGMPRRARRPAITRALERCELGDVQRRRIGQLSRGYRQRVGLAAAMLHDPPALILDEPTSALDPRQVKQIRGVIRGLAADRAVLVSSHILAEVEQTCDRVVILSRGTLVADARPADLIRTDPATPYDLEARPAAGAPALVDALHRVAGVAAVSQANLADGWLRMLITPAPAAPDLRQALAAAAIGAGAALRELSRQRPSLERVFLSLIESGAAEPAPGGRPGDGAA
jgi:ABC-2 type transport system ATP-binding protein